MRSTRPFAQDYMTLIARAYAARADRVSEPTPPGAVVRTNFVTLYKPRVGLKVQAWFLRHTPSKTPELRVGIAFDLVDREANAKAAGAFAARFAPELSQLAAEPWPGETQNDRRYMTPLPCPPAGTDLTEITTRAAELARRYVELLQAAEIEPRIDTDDTDQTGRSC